MCVVVCTLYTYKVFGRLFLSRFSICFFLVYCLQCVLTHFFMGNSFEHKNKLKLFGWWNFPCCFFLKCRSKKIKWDKIQFLFIYKTFIMAYLIRLFNLSSNISTFFFYINHSSFSTFKHRKENIYIKYTCGAMKQEWENQIGELEEQHRWCRVPAAENTCTKIFFGGILHKIIL